MTLPLDGIRVVDLTDGAAQGCGRLLADLGAEVILAEPPGGCRARREPPFHQGASLPFALRNANKLGVTVAPGSPAWLDLVTSADILLTSSVWPSDRVEPPAPVLVSITDFGLTGPYSGWQATEPVLYAMGGVLARSGPPGAEPVLPPPGLAGAAGLRARVPAGHVEINGARAGFRHRAPEPGEHNDVVIKAVRRRAARPSVPAAGRGPLDGLRVLDLGVIVFGAELGRLFADQGADVIKIENSAFPDGLRQSRRGDGMSASFAWGHRNKRGIGLDLRSRDGAAIFRSLAERSDVVLANFKPGTPLACSASPMPSSPSRNTSCWSPWCFILGPGPRSFLVGAALSAWITYARLVRSVVLRLRTTDYVLAARAGGLGHRRVLPRHVLPNALPTAIVYAASDVVLALGFLCALSYLGLGIQAPAIEWGRPLLSAINSSMGCRRKYYKIIV